MSTETTPPLSSGKRDALIGLGLAAVFFLLYLRTLCPTVYLGDSGEITTAIATGGIVHPPGYPLFSLLGRLVLALVPVGEPAFRVGLIVITAAAAAVGVLFVLGREIGCSRWAAASAAAAYGVSFTFWNQSTRVEVYSLHVLLASLTLLWALRYRKSERLSHLAAATLLGSVGVAHHLTIVLLGPALLLLFGRRFWTAPALPKRLALVLSCLLVGPACYLLLALWSSANPLYDWSHPAAASGLWYHASGAMYQGMLHVPTPGYLATRLGQAWGLASDNFPYGTLFLAAAGAALLWRRDRTLAGGLLALFATVVAYNQFYRIEDIAAYYLLPWLVCALLLAVALDALYTRIPRSNARLAASVLACVLLAGVGLYRNWSGCDLSRFVWVREFARQKLESVDPNGVLITQGDDDIAPVNYAHDVLGIRPDVLPLDVVLCNSPWKDARDHSLWYIRHLRHRGLNVPLELPADPALRQDYANDGFLFQLLNTELRNRPFCVTGLELADKPDRPFFHQVKTQLTLLPQGLVLRVLRRRERVDLKSAVQRNDRLWQSITLPALGNVRTDQEMDADYLQEHYATMLLNLGGLHELQGDTVGAAAIYQRVAAWNPAFVPARTALAALKQKSSASPANASKRS